MITREEIHLFRTPDKQPKPDDQPRNSSTAVLKPFLLPKPTYNLEKKLERSIIDPQITQDTAYKNNKERSSDWKRDQKKYVLSEAGNRGENKRDTPSVVSFLSHPIEEQNKESQLKNISKRVQHLLKDGIGYKVHSHQEQIALLKNENKRIQILAYQFQTLIGAQSSQNQAKKSQIAQNNLEKLRQKSEQMLPPINQNKRIQEKKGRDDQSHSIQGVASIKKYLLQYVNTIAQANDEKLSAQQKYITALQKRLQKIQDIRAQIEHLKFQKHVKLQECTRKSKNYSQGAPNITGEQIQLKFEMQMTPNSESGRSQKRYFKNNPVQQSAQFKQIKQRNISLQQSLQRLQGKYQSQLQRYIKLNSDYEQNQIRIQKLQAQKTDLKFQLFDVNQRLKLSQQKIGQLQKFIMTQRLKTIQQLGKYNSSFSLKEQLYQIKQQLQRDGLQKLKILQKQVFELIIQKSTFKKQLSELQHTRIQEQSKFSDVYKQIFALKQANGLLQQKCQGYEKILNNMSPDNIPHFVSVDKEHNSNIKGIQQITLCVVGSINRLDNLAKQIEYSQTTQIAS